MSFIGIALATVIPGGGLGVWIATRLFGMDKVAKAGKAAAGFIAANWKPLAIIGAIAAAVIYFLILHGEIRHRDKTIAGQAALIGQVKTEVDRGVGKATPAADAPAYVHGFVDNLRTVTAALDRQSAALKVAQQQADAHVAAAHEAAQLTPAQGERDKVRQKIADPARTTGLTADEWGRL